MTREELNELKPSWDNKVELECFDGTGCLSVIIVVTPFVNGRCCAIDKEGDLLRFDTFEIGCYFIKKKTKRYWQWNYNHDDGGYRTNGATHRNWKGVEKEKIEDDYKDVEVK